MLKMQKLVLGGGGGGGGNNINIVYWAKFDLEYWTLIYFAWYWSTIEIDDKNTFVYKVNISAKYYVFVQFHIVAYR